MISKSTIKLVKSLSLKKFRNKESLFLVEGDKMVLELFKSDINIKELFITNEFSQQFKFDAGKVEKISEVDKQELKKISQLKTPQNSAAICRIPEQLLLPEKLDDALVLYLDGIQDPGNFGTIIRICDWFGINKLFCSTDTVDLYNPKVIQASMGSFCRVNVWECAFEKMKIIAGNSNATTYGAFMNGSNIYSEQLAPKAILVMGNEGNGIRQDVEQLIEKQISIPNFSENNSKAESLNVSVATSILCSEFKRGKYSYSK